LFVQNGAAGSGGGMRYNGTFQSLLLTNCQFYENQAFGSSVYSVNQGGGGLVVVYCGKCNIQDCIFAWNGAKRGGGISVLRPSTVNISRCELFGNTGTNGGGGLYLHEESGSSGDLKVEVQQSVLWGNTASAYGGGIWGGGTAATTANKQRLYVLNSCIVSNTAASGGAAFNIDYGYGWIENSILWGNATRLGAASTLSVRTTCLAEAGSYPGTGNINADPSFEDVSSGNLRLKSSSPCIDRGNNYMDYDMLTPGFQSLPAADMDGNWRIVDGNSDGNAKVDMGPYEKQSP